MIVVEPVPVHATAVLTRGNFLSDDDAVMPHFRRLTDACHEAAAGDGGVVMIQQLYHVGQHGDAANSFRENWSPSGLPSMHDADGSHAMTETEIEEIVGAFVRAAVRARRERLRRGRGVRRLPRARRPVLDAVVEPAHRPLGRHRSPTECASRPLCWTGSGRRAATTSSSVSPSTSTPTPTARCRRPSCRRSSPGTTSER